MGASLRPTIGTLVALALASADAGLAQLLPLGSEFQVSTGAPCGFRCEPAAAAAAGSFVVVWGEYGAVDEEVVARRVDPSAGPVGASFPVNTHTTAEQRQPALAGAPDGSFVVAWQSYDQDGDNDGIFAQRFDAGGAPAGGEFPVNTFTDESQRRPAVAADDTGFVVAWQSYNQLHFNDDEDIFARRFDATGAPLGGELQVNANTSNQQRRSSVARLPGGDFVIVWESEYGYPCCADGVYAQRYDGSGTPLGGEFLIRADGLCPRVAAGGGGFVVVYQSYDLGSGDVFGRRFDVGGTPMGAEFPVNTHTPFTQAWPAIAVDGTGRFLVVWDSLLQDGSDRGVFARLFGADGAPRGGELQVNTYTTYSQAYPTVAADAAGHFVVAWSGIGAGGYGIQARGFLAPACAPMPRTGCRQPTLPPKGRLTVKDRTPDRGDAIAWTWVKGEETLLAGLGDPLGTDAYSLCLYDGAGGLLARGSTIGPGGTCGGVACWTALGSSGFRFVDPARTQDGVRKIVLRAGGPGRAKAVVKAKGEAVDPPTLPLVLPVRVQLQATNGSCWEAGFDAAGVVRNEAELFTGRASIPVPWTTTTTTSTTTTTTLPPCGIIPDPFEPTCGGSCPAGSSCVGEIGAGLELGCACLPDALVPCIGSGYPACGGGCAAPRVCQGFHLVPGEGPELTICACVDPGDTCDDPPGTCFAIGACPAGQVCVGQGAPTSACGCGLP